MNKYLRKNISFTNKDLKNLLDSSTNASKLVEEALIYYLYNLQEGELNDRDRLRILSQGLVQLEDLDTLFKNMF